MKKLEDEIRSNETMYDSFEAAQAVISIVSIWCPYFAIVGVLLSFVEMFLET